MKTLARFLLLCLAALALSAPPPTQASASSGWMEPDAVINGGSDRPSIPWTLTSSVASVPGHDAPLVNPFVLGPAVITRPFRSGSPTATSARLTALAAPLAPKPRLDDLIIANV